MTHLVVQIAPQRNTQYAGLARGLAPHELALSPLAEPLTTCNGQLGGQEYLSFDLTDPDHQTRALTNQTPRLGACWP
jgi:hypothetical protein